MAVLQFNTVRGLVWSVAAEAMKGVNTRQSHRISYKTSLFDSVLLDSVSCSIESPIRITYKIEQWSVTHIVDRHTLSGRRPGTMTEYYRRLESKWRVTFTPTYRNINIIGFIRNSLSLRPLANSIVPYEASPNHDMPQFSRLFSPSFPYFLKIFPLRIKF